MDASLSEGTSSNPNHPFTLAIILLFSLHFFLINTPIPFSIHIFHFLFPEEYTFSATIFFEQKFSQILPFFFISFVDLVHQLKRYSFMSSYFVFSPSILASTGIWLFVSRMFFILSMHICVYVSCFDLFNYISFILIVFLEAYIQMLGHKCNSRGRVLECGRASSLYLTIELQDVFLYCYFSWLLYF